MQNFLYNVDIIINAFSRTLFTLCRHAKERHWRLARARNTGGDKDRKKRVRCRTGGEQVRERGSSRVVTEIIETAVLWALKAV